MQCRLDGQPFDLHSRAMKAAIALAFSLMVMGCSQTGDESPAPRAGDVDKLESRLSGHPCIGQLDGWERNYRLGMSRRMFWPQSDYPDLDVVEFHFRKAGTIAIAPTRNLVTASQNRDWRDSSSIQTIDGSFVVSSGRLNLARCEPLRPRSN